MVAAHGYVQGTQHPRDLKFSSSRRAPEVEALAPLLEDTSRPAWIAAKGLLVESEAELGPESDC